MLYGFLLGLRVNLAVVIRDGGEDFPGVDVKTSVYFDDPWLRVPANEPLRAPLYWLAAFDKARRLARPIGYATREMVARAPVRNLAGHGPSLTLREGDLL